METIMNTDLKFVVRRLNGLPMPLTGDYYQFLSEGATVPEPLVFQPNLVCVQETHGFHSSIWVDNQELFNQLLETDQSRKRYLIVQDIENRVSTSYV